MATGVNNGGNPTNPHITYTNSPTPERGIAGYMQGQQTQRQFNERFWGNKGYLTESISELQTMKKTYEEISKVSDQMTKAEQRAAKDKLDAVKQQLSLLKAVKESGEITDIEAINLIKQSNKIRLQGQQEYIKLLQDGLVIQKDSNKNQSDFIDEAINKYNDLKEKISGIDVELKKTAKSLNATGDNFATSIGKTLGNAGSKLTELVNMLNISSIANNEFNKQAQQINAMRTSTSQQFGFNDTQYNNFISSLQGTLDEMNQSMGNLFSLKDMTTYLSNMSEYGVVNSQLAEDNFKDSVIATKYLSTSNETMTQIFKFMKLTNDTDAVSKHNRTVVGLMKSQLGISASQLDALTEMAYTSANDLQALGMTNEALDTYTKTSTASGAVLSSMLGNEKSGEAVQQMYADFLNSGLIEDTEKWGALLGNQMQSIYQTGMNATDDATAQRNMKAFFQAIQNSGALNQSNSTATKFLIGEYGLGTTEVNALRALNLGEYDEKMYEALKNIDNTTKEDVDNYVEQSVEATILDKISNWLESTFGTSYWNMLPALAVTAFSMQIGSGIFTGLGKFISGFTNSGGLKTGLTSLLGGSAAGGGTVASAAMSSLAAGGVVVGLTAAAITGIAAASEQMTARAQSKYSNEATNALKGTNLEGNQAVIGSYATTEATSHKSWWQKNLGSIGSGFGYITSGIVGSKDGSYKNEKLIKWMYDNGSLNNQLRTLAIAYIMDSINDLDAFNNALGTSYTHKDLKQLLDTGTVTKESIDRAAQDWFDADYSFYDSYGNRFKSFSLDLNGYKKNGMVYVPKDNYRALLHRGEMVLTADEANLFRSALNIDRYGNTMNVGGPSGGSLYGQGGDYDSLVGLIHSPWTRISSMWGNRPNPFGGGSTENHGGIDIAAPSNTPIGSATSGTVYTAGWVDGFGNAVYISGSNGMNYIYGHMVKTPSVSKGQSVTAGQLIGYVGSTGRSTGPHLHFQVDANNAWNKANSVDPAPYLNTGVLYPGSGSVEGVSITTSDSNVSSTGVTTNISSGKFIPKAFTNSNVGGPIDDGPDMATRISSSVDNGFKNLINYLESIKKEQSAQREILNAFSKSRTSESNFNY